MSLNSNNNLTPESYQNPGPVPYFPQVFNPGPPLVQQPAVVHVVPPEAFYYLKDADEHSLRLAVKVEQLEQQLREKERKEEAYTKIFADGKRTWTMTESGRPVELLDAALIAAFRVIPQGPVEHPVSYGLEFTGQESLIVLDEPAYLDDKRLIHNLQTAGIRVTIRRSTRATAALVRQCISAGLVTVRANFYGGWKMADQGPVFLRFQNFSSHQGRNYLNAAQPAAEVSPTVAAMAVTQLAQTFQAICSPALRWLLFAWFHASFLLSLLRPAGSALPMGICLYTQEPVIQRWLERLFCWYGDPAINLDDRPTEFSKAMWSRKDQPAVLIDRHQTKNASRNALLLEEILTTGGIAWKDGRKETTIPLRASVVVLCDTISSLCCSPKLLTLEIQPEDFDLELCQRQLEQAPVHQDYLQALASYTAAHWPELQEFLRQGRTQAAAFAVNADILAGAGTLLGVVRFADAFCRFCGAEDVSISLNRGVTPETLQELFSQTASSISGIDAAQQFCQIAQHCMASSAFYICNADRDDSDGVKPVVYLIREDYGFTTEAFRTVCRRMSQSTPVIARALSEEGLLRGKRTNSTTMQTRIPVTNVYGNCRYVGVYRIAQEHILSEML